MAKKKSKKVKKSNTIKKLKKARKPAKVAKKKVSPLKKKPAKKTIVKKTLPKKKKIYTKGKVKPVVKKKAAPDKKIKIVKAKPVKTKPVVVTAKALPLKEKENKAMLAAPPARKVKSKKTAQPPIIPPEPDSIPLKVTVKSGPKKPEPKGKYIMEFSVRSSIPVLFEFVSTPSGLEEWFSDNVHVQTGGFFTFFWDGVGQQAKLIGYKELEMVRFEWLAKKDDGSYFEFRIQTDELTGDVSLIVTDFADPAELETNKLVWASQVDRLLHIIGSYSP